VGEEGEKGEKEGCNAYLPWVGGRRRRRREEDEGGRRGVYLACSLRPRGVGVRVLSLLLHLSHLFPMPPKSSIHWQRSTLGRLRVLGTQFKSTTRPGRAPVIKTTLGPKGIEEYRCAEEHSLRTRLQRELIYLFKLVLGKMVLMMVL
jgi:hypothetical protein